MGAAVIFALLLGGFFLLPIVLITSRTSLIVKWTSTLLAALFFGFAVLSALPSDIPPCHMIVPFVLYTAAAYRQWFYPSGKSVPPGHCRNCAYDLTGNVSGVCLECGTPVQDQMADKPPASTIE